MNKKMKESKTVTIEQMKELEKKLLIKHQNNSYNQIDYSNYNSFDEFYDEMEEIRNVLESKLWIRKSNDDNKNYLGGTSIEGNGVNYNFTFNGKPFHLRVKVDKYHSELWKKDKFSYWSDDFDRNQLNIDCKVESKTIIKSKKIVDRIPHNRITYRFKNFLRDKILYNILSIYYRYQLKN